MKTIVIAEPNTPYLEKLHGTIKEGTIFRFKIKLITNGSHFTINLKSGPSSGYEKVPLHLSLRPGLSPDYIRNTATQAVWGIDELSVGMPLQINVVYDVNILCQKDSFKIMIEGINYAEYKYRLPLDTIDHIHLAGAGVIYSVIEEYENLKPEFNKYEHIGKEIEKSPGDIQQSNFWNNLFIRMPYQIIFNYDHCKDENKVG